MSTKETIARRVYGLSPAGISLAYLSLGLVWIAVSDLVLIAIAETGTPFAPDLLNETAFVALSALFVYGVATLHQRRVDGVRRELETSNQQIQVLSRVLRHNIRNDLNVVRGYTNLLDERVDDDRSRRYLETIRETTDEVVDISRKLRMIEDVDPEDAEEGTDLVDVVEDAIADLDRDGVEVDVELPETARIRADSSVGYPVREVFENAIAHNDKEVCRVVVRIDSEGEETLLRVRDNGPGIPESEREVLRSEEETPLSHASSIGLWLIKWMCELQGGRVAFEDNGREDGTTVELRFRSAGPETNGTAA